MLELNDKEFLKISELIYSSFGIVLDMQKKELLRGRLNKLLKNKPYNDFATLYNKLLNDNNGQLLQELANVVSTNTTHFNRENGHFDYFTKMALPSVTKNIHDFDLRIWCCASSSGEEPYTLAMLQKEYFGEQYSSWDAGVLATDISTDILRKAARGSYKAENVEKVPKNLKEKYFIHTEGENYDVKAEIKREVTFRKLNLVKNFSFKKPFHMIFCRNVMIYFDQKTKDNLIQRLYEWTAPGGYLFIGHSESIPRDRCPYKPICPAVYQKV